jgi:hypothetical protein
MYISCWFGSEEEHIELYLGCLWLRDGFLMINVYNSAENFGCWIEISGLVVKIVVVINRFVVARGG